MELDQKIVERLTKLDEKFQAMGQDLTSYLDGLLYADYLTYWDYIHLDTLLSLQTPKTPFKDEEIFIMYHQITELYFKLTLHELKQISEHNSITTDFFVARLTRCNRYFDALVNSFEIMVDGMERDQFLKFRMSLLPASGFQSGQYRMIEIYATPFYNLVAKDVRANFSKDSAIEEMYKHIYWQEGATELASGKKTLTLVQFEEKYGKQFLSLAKNTKNKTVWDKYLELPEEDKKSEKVKNALKFLDTNVNVNWPLSHYKSAVRYLQKNPEDIVATGGTNWQKYLPPRFQKRIFYPKVWLETEIADWGKNWVKRVAFGME